MGEQIKIGTQFEKNLAKLLQKYKFWVYNMPVKTNGQPCDIVAIRKNIAFLIDSKHVDTNKVSFTFDRIEPNQIAALAYAYNYAGIQNVGFAIYFERDREWYWLSYQTFLYMHNLGEKSANKSLLQKFVEVLDENVN